MRYRTYDSQDFARLYAIEEACFQPPLRFGPRYMRLLVHSSEAATWVAEQEGQMAGFGIVEWAENRDETVAYIQTLEVAPDWRGQGVGRELLLRLEAAARAEGAQRIWLHVDENNAPALGLYRTRGYRFLYREEDYYGPGSTALIHSKPL